MLTSLTDAGTEATLKPARSPLKAADEIAAPLGVPADQVLAWAREGRIPVHRFSRKVIRFNPAEVYAALGVPEFAAL